MTKRLQNITQAEWNRPLRTPCDSLEVLQRAQAISGSDVQVVGTGRELICVHESTTYEDSWELFGDTVVNWSITSPQAFVDYLISSKKDWFVNGIDGMTSGKLDSVALTLPANIVDVESKSWDDWLAKRSKKHRYRIKQNLALAENMKLRWFDPFELEATDCSFEKLLRGQVEYLKRKVWIPNYDTSCIERTGVVWAAWVQAIAQTREVHPEAWVVYNEREQPVSITLTSTIGDRTFFIITLSDHSTADFGVSTLAAAVKAAVDDPKVKYFDMMIGNNHYKRLYEPDVEAVSYLLSVHTKPFWLDPSAEVSLIPTPPFIVGDKLYLLEPHEIPRLG